MNSEMPADDSVECSIVGSDDPILYPPTNSGLGSFPDELVSFGYYVDDNQFLSANDSPSSQTSPPSHHDSGDSSLFPAGDPLIHLSSTSYDFDNAFHYQN
jgi:hypothetical protein